MHKVICERPRGGQYRAKQFPRPKGEHDELPKYEGIRRPHRDRKWFGEHLGPLRRWLRSQVGRPWDDVYSEACAVITSDSVVRNHIKVLLLEFVLRHTFIREGRMWCFTNQLGTSEKLVEEAANKWSPFYVHPLTRLLCEALKPSRKRWCDPKAEHRSRTQQWLNETTVFRQIKGCWFECTLEKFPKRFAKRESPWRFDLAERKLICRSNAREIYDRDVYCVAKRQLSRKELKVHRLTNANMVFPASTGRLAARALLARGQAACFWPSPISDWNRTSTVPQFAGLVLRIGWSFAVRFRTSAGERLMGDWGNLITARGTGSK